MSRVLTLEKVKEIDDCQEAIKAFETRYGNQVVITEEFAASDAACLDWDWLSLKLLSPEGRAAYKAVAVIAWESYSYILEYPRFKYRDSCDSAMELVLQIKARAFAREYIKETPE
jgi:hypothetical protein